MKPELIALAVLLLAASQFVLAADLPAVRCGVRAASPPAAPRHEFGPTAKTSALADGFVASAGTRAVPGGRRVDATVADATGTEREVVMDFQVKVPGDFTHVFLADGRGPQPLSATGSATYRGACCLPAVTFFGADSGVTVAAPFEVPAPSLTFSWVHTPEAVDVTVTISNLRLPAQGQARAGLLIGRHEGCWRPGLGWLVSLYPEYFDPPNPKVWDDDGPMIYDFVSSESRLRRDLAQGLAWQELGWSWPHLGLYLPEGQSWQRQSSADGGLGEGGTVTRQMLNDYIALSNRLGVAQCLYFQSTESWADYAEKQFPECRVRNANGDLAPTWIKCVVMDPSPDGRFGQHIVQQARGLTEAFPGMAGVFWDQNCYTGFDFAHDDGISMVNGRRVSMMEFPQNRVQALAGKILHDRGKVIFTNGGWTVGLARYCDGHMSEGTGPTRQLQYICMRKHLTLLAYDSNPKQAREKLLLALETGAQPSVTLGDDRCRALCEGYVPIFRQLRHKTWVFTPRALTLPEATVGNIFRNGEGNYLVTAVADEAHAAPLEQEEKPGVVRVRVPDAREVAGVFGMFPPRRGWQAVSYRREPDGFSIDLPRPHDGAGLLLARRGRWVAGGTSRLIAGQRQPLSVAVANLTSTPWAGPWVFTIGQRHVERTLRLASFQVQEVPLGSVSPGQDETMVAIEVTGPAQGGDASATTLEIPVVSAVGLRVPADVVQVRRGETVSYVISNRLPEAATVTVRAHWQGTAEAPEAATETLAPGQVKVLTAPTQALPAGLWELHVETQWPGGSQTQTVRADVVDAVLPKSFGVSDVAGLTVRMDLFNSLGEQWADKPVKINGMVVGRLPLTGGTLRWHDGLTLDVPAETARQVFSAGLQANGDLQLAVSVENRVGNCFKVRNVQASLLGRSGGKYLSTCARDVVCSDGGWLYAEGKCVRLGEAVPAGTVTLIRQQ